MSMSDTDRGIDPGPRSAAEIERDVERTRAGLTNTLDELRERAQPGQLFEQAMDYVRSSGGNDMVRNLGQQVRDNPLPLLLIGAGIGWLMMSGGGRSGTGSYASGTQAAPGYRPAVGAGSTRVRVYGGAESGEGMTGRASAALGSAKDSVAGAADQAIDRAGQAYRGAAGAVSDAAEGVRDTAVSVADSVRGAASATAERVGDATQDLRWQAAQATDQARQGVGWLMREQPLVLGAIGVALGAAVGALLPGTEAEDRLMGQTRDQVADRVQATAREGYERVKDTAGEHLERAQGAAGQATNQAAGQAGGVGSALTDAAREVRQAARDAAHDLAGEAKSSLGSEPKREEPRPGQPAGQPQTSPRVGPV